MTLTTESAYQPTSYYASWAGSDQPDSVREWLAVNSLRATSFDANVAAEIAEASELYRAPSPAGLPAKLHERSEVPKPSRSEAEEVEVALPRRSSGPVDTSVPLDQFAPFFPATPGGEQEPASVEQPKDADYVATDYFEPLRRRSMEGRRPSLDGQVPRAGQHAGVEQDASNLVALY